MPEPETIFAHVGRLLDGDGLLRGRRVVVTAGPTREPIDPVRFLSNRSTGKMGVAVAAAAWRRGADVTLIAGPLAVLPPVGTTLVSVETTAEMLAAVTEHMPTADVLVMAAAPSDFRPAVVAPQKIKKTVAPSSIPLAATEDVLVATRAVRPPRAIVVGFALETQAALIGGRTKLEQKALDMVVVNDATEPGAGFEKDTNRVSFLIGDAEPEELPLLDKADVAEAILDRVEGIMRGR
jgi:phosphopantothenoylcysteine decarboxylase/phosphopantothenate--cysteine ligase